MKNTFIISYLLLTGLICNADGVSQCTLPVVMRDNLSSLSYFSYKCPDSNNITVSTSYKFCSRHEMEFCNESDEYTETNNYNNHTFLGSSATITWHQNNALIKTETITSPTYIHDNTAISILDLRTHVCITGTTSVNVPCSTDDEIKVRISNSNATTITSTTRVSTYGSASINSHPTGGRVCWETGSVELKVTSEYGAGHPTLTCNWYKYITGNSGNSSLVTNTNRIGYSNEFSLTVMDARHPGGKGAGTYFAKIVNQCGQESSKSNNATVEFNYPLQITQPIGNVNACSGNGTGASFTVLFNSNAHPTNSSPTFEWYKGEKRLRAKSTLSNTYTLNTLASDSAGTYSVIVKSSVSCGADVSSTGILSVASPVTIDTPPVSTTICQNGTVTLQAKATPKYGDNISYKWQKEISGLWLDVGNTIVSNEGNYTITTETTEIPTGINKLTISQLHFNPLIDPLTFTRGFSPRRFKVVCSDACLSSPAVSTVASISAYNNPSVTDAQDISLCINGSGQMSVTATSSHGPLSYNWEVSKKEGTTFTPFASVNIAELNPEAPGNNKVIYTINGNVLNFANVPSSYNGYKYQVKVRDGCGEATQVTTTAKTLTVYQKVSISKPNDVGICQEGSTTFTGTVTPGNPNTNDSNMIRQWQVKNTGSGANWVDLSNTPVYFEGLDESTLHLANLTLAYTGYKYRLRAKDACGAVSENFSEDATLTVYPSPTVSTPNNLSVCINEGGVLSATATSSIPSGSTNPSNSITYQWQSSNPDVSNYHALNNGNDYSGVSGVSVSGVTNPTLTINPSVSTNNNNNRKYRVKVYDGCGTYFAQYSEPATLSVHSNVIFTKNLENVTSCRNTNAQFSVTVAPGKGAISYRWEQKSLAPDNITVVWNTITSSSVYSIGTSGTLNSTGALDLISVPESYSGATYRVIASDECGTVSQSTSNERHLVITPLAGITFDNSVVSGCSGNPITIGGTATGANTYGWQYAQADKIEDAVFVDQAGALASYTINSPTLANTGFYRMKVSNSCNNISYSLSKKLGFKDKINVDIGANINLCSRSGIYNLAADIKTEGAEGAFTWRVGEASINATNFDPSIYSVGAYTITYNVSNGTYPRCFNGASTRVITILEGGASGIQFNVEKAPNKTISGCVGDASVFLNELVTPTGGTWAYGDGQANGLSVYGENRNYYTYKTENVNANYNTLRYTVVHTNGCTVMDILKVSSKNNITEYTVTGVPEIVCPDTPFTVSMSSNVISEPLTFEVYEDGKLHTASNPPSLKIPTDKTKKTVTIKSINAFSCKSIGKEFFVKTPFSLAEIVADKTKVSTGEVISFAYSAEGRTTVSWDFGDGFTGDIQTPKHIYYKGGTYTVLATVTSHLGCTKQLSKSIEVIGAAPNIVTGMDNPSTSCSLSPNPVQDILRVKNTEEKKAIVYSADGRCFMLSVEGGIMDMSSFSSGLYVIRIGNQTFKIIKQ